MQGEPSVRGGVDLAERPPVGAAIQPPMPPTDIRNPDYFHKVVDCQWACPAHTPVPEYIRLIAAGRYTDAYMVNWKSNVFPGILGRTCDRPCEPACRRGRVESERAGRHLPAEARRRRQQGRHHRPPAAGRRRKQRQAHRLVGAGPASLTVARDLAPLGYEVVVFDGDAQGRRHDPQPDPALPPARRGDRRGGRLHPRPRHRDRGSAQRIDSLKALLAEGYDAVFVGSRRAARPRPRHPGPPGSRGQHPHRHRLAVRRVVRPHRRRSASA